RAAVHQCRREDVGMSALLPRAQQTLVIGPLDVEQGVRCGQQRRFDVVEPQHSQSGDDLRDRRPEIRHYVCPPAAYLRSASYPAEVRISITSNTMSSAERSATSPSLPLRGRCDVRNTMGPLPARASTWARPSDFHTVSVRSSPP